MTTQETEGLVEREAANKRHLARIAKISKATTSFKVAPGADTWDAWCEACPPSEILWLAGFARVVLGQCDVAQERERAAIEQRDSYSREWDNALTALQTSETEASRWKEEVGRLTSLLNRAVGYLSAAAEQHNCDVCKRESEDLARSLLPVEETPNA